MTDPFVKRYVSPEMAQIWDRDNTLELQRALWLRVLDAQATTGMVKPPDGALAAYERTHERLTTAAQLRRDIKRGQGTKDPEEFKKTFIYVDYLARLREAEQRTRHDLKAHLEAFDRIAGGHGLLHLGLTSSDITENVAQDQTWQASDLAARRVAATLARLANYAELTADEVIVGRTHGMPAQATTVGHRAARCAQELLFAFDHLQIAGSMYGRRRGIVGAVGTAADLWHLANGDRTTVERFQSRSLPLAGPTVLAAVGQNYPRSLDWEVASSLVQVAMGPASFATTMRLMASQGLLYQRTSDGQVGSSAMPHKNNPNLWERVCGLQDVLRGYAQMIQSTAGRTWNEGDVSDSVVRRVALPGLFYSIDALLHTFCYALDHILINHDERRTELAQYTEQLASGRLLAEYVRRGWSRERAHASLQGAYATGALDLQWVADELKVGIGEVGNWARMSRELPGLVPSQIEETIRRVDAALGGITRDEAIAGWEVGEVL